MEPVSRGTLVQPPDYEADSHEETFIVLFIIAVNFMIDEIFRQEKCVFTCKICVNF